MSQPQQPAAQPKSVLRGHLTQVHAATFIRHNERLATGDADGFVVLWDLTIMRPRAVWRAHNAAILGIAGWGDDKVITEGRDNRLVVWKITPTDEENLSTDLPLDESAPERPQPWILHILEINTMNFCSFAQCSTRQDTDPAVSDELFVAVPNTLATEAVDIFHLPTQNRISTVHLGSKAEKKGMVMALSLFWRDESLFLLAGYENGLAVVARRRHGGAWDILYKYKAHSQPILSLDFAPDKQYFLTSGADAILAKHPIPNANPTTPLVPVSKRAEKPETGGTNTGPDEARRQPTGAGTSVPSAGLTSTSSSSNTETPPHSLPKKVTDVEASPLKIVDTKHSGQQGLQIRSDGRIFATAGWDSKVRVYSAKTMSELAVLKWHDVGCYAAAFSMVNGGQKETFDEPEAGPQQGAVQGEPNAAGESPAAGGNGIATVTAVGKLGELSVKDRRIRMAKDAHWLAAGSKDGKISLWDIY
ncbi:WD repeat-containing protein [Nemania sp. FL0031]|nr:WD repeat-containing protein [Nemania sp. FL0031]